MRLSEKISTGNLNIDTTFYRILLSVAKLIMNKLFLIVLFTTTVCLACEKDAVSRRTYEYFAAHLKPSMDYNQVARFFGEPDVTQGSGILHYIYNLRDGTFISISVTGHISSALHIDNNGNVLHVLI